MAQVSTNELRQGMKVEIDNEPYNVVNIEFIKPGKGQAFNRLKLKNLISGRMLERTFKAGDKLAIADIVESNMRLLYIEIEGAVFMDDETFEQLSIGNNVIAAIRQWLKDDIVYGMVFYKGSVIEILPPTFMELVITETDPGVRGDTASGRVLKPAKLETGAEVQVPIFINESESIKVDTRTGEYVSRVS